MSRRPLTALLLLLAAAPARALTAVEKEVLPVVDLFYDLQFSSAAAAADALAARHPGHPAGPFYRSVVDYQRFIADGGKDKSVLAAFETESSSAVAAAEAWRSTSDAEGLYYDGVARGFRARVLAAQKRYLKALPEGLRAVRSLKAALARDPNLEDAYLGLGMYEYFAARMPPAAKPFAYMVGAGWGDKEKGLEDLRRAAERGGPARMEARSMLSSVYALEGRWPESIELLRELVGRYPRNPLYRLRLTYALERAGRWEDALASCDPDAAGPSGAWLPRVPAALRHVAEGPALYRAAEIELILGRVDAAAARLERLAGRDLGEGVDDFVKLRRANVLDARGDRKKALKLYGALRRKEAVGLSRSFLEKPYPNGSKDVMPWLGLETPR